MSDTRLEGDVFVRASWDSGPYGVYSVADDPVVVPADWYGSRTACVPSSVWLRYVEARDAFWAAEEELDGAIRGGASS